MQHDAPWPRKTITNVSPLPQSHQYGFLLFTALFPLAKTESTRKVKACLSGGSGRLKTASIISCRTFMALRKESFKMYS
jgi:hypothetical protein